MAAIRDQDSCSYRLWDNRRSGVSADRHGYDQVELGPAKPDTPRPNPYRPRHPGFSSSTAIPCPPPMHTAATPYLSPSARN